jgi:hypothetical protein
MFMRTLDAGARHRREGPHEIMPRERLMLGGRRRR